MWAYLESGVHILNFMNFKRRPGQFKMNGSFKIPLIPHGNYPIFQMTALALLEFLEQLIKLFGNDNSRRLLDSESMFRTERLMTTNTKTALFQSVLQQVKSILHGTGNRTVKLQAICEQLASAVPYFHWVGFYLVDPAKSGELVLGPYVGAATEHVRIPFGKGICGQAAESGQPFIVQDVSKETNYLACSPAVKSEIVLPILSDGKVIGELDIDSHEISPFSTEDRDYLEQICEQIAESLFE
ncbi:GAF domain-containing protein [candidate division KSB1 bacterium]|nr:GAF domain-containing protein [candidate division KSB1 bacterium]